MHDQEIGNSERKKERDIRLFIFSLVFLNIYNWVSVVEMQHGIPPLVKYVLALAVLCIIIYYKFSNPSKPSPEGLIYPVMIFFLIWSSFLIASEILNFNNLFYLQRLFGQRYYFIPYLLPFLILYSNFDIDFFKEYLKYSFIFIIPVILMQFTVAATLTPENYYENIHRIGIFDIGSSILLLTAHFFKNKKVSYAVLLYVLVMIALFLLYGRRGKLIETGLLLLFMMWIRVKSSLLALHDRMKIYFSVLLALFAVLAFSYIFESTLAFQRGFSKAGFEESRGLVLEDFLIDFNKTSEWIFGRGIDGRILRTINLETGTESLIENGYLTVILKGGFLYLVPLVLIILKACYMGFFKSSNDLCKGLAAILLIYLVIMFSFNLPDFSSKYIFIWIAISANFNTKLRRLTNNEIYNAINAKR